MSAYIPLDGAASVRGEAPSFGSCLIPRAGPGTRGEAGLARSAAYDLPAAYLVDTAYAHRTDTRFAGLLDFCGPSTR